MKPVAIFRCASSEGPGYFASFLEARALPWSLVRLDAGERVPRHAGAFSGIAVMGGPMSANDELPWVAPLLELVRDAARRDLPAIGHCLGAQLMARAFGGTVRRNPVKEIGWGEVRVADNGAARAWLGELAAFESFHWHGETFSIPYGEVRVLENGHCANQGFALGKHLGLQCHVEMTAELVRDWCRGGAEEIRASASSPAVQEPREIERDLEPRLEALHRVADRLYERWIGGLSRGN